MSFPEVQRRVYRDRIGLLRPSRGKADTEYNSAYKKWPLNPIALKTFRVKVLKSWKSDSRPKYASSGYQDSCSSGSSCSDLASTVCSAPVEPPMLSEEWFESNKINSALNTRTAPIHERPQRKNKKKRMDCCEEYKSKLIPKPSRPCSYSKNIRHLNEQIAIDYKTCRQKQNEADRKEAWGKSRITGAENSGRNYDDTHSEGPTSDRVKMGDLCLALDRMDCWNHPDDICIAECDYIDDLPSQHSLQQVRSESVISMKPFDPKMEGKPADRRSAPVVRPGSARSARTKYPKTPPPSPNKKKKSMRSTAKTTESDIKKLYHNLSPEEVLQLQNAYNGLVGTKRDKSKTPSKTTMEDVDTFRETAIRTTNYPYICRTGKDWKTSYNSDYGKRSTAREIFQNVNTLYKSNFIDPKPRSGSPVPKFEQAKKETTTNGKKTTFNTEEPHLTKDEKERIIQEAAKIVDREYKASLSLDGRPKLANEKTSSNYGGHKAWAVKKPITPIWADKTVKSLGSGHWNLPLNKEENWRLKAEQAAQCNEDFVPSDRVRPAFKLHIGDPTKDQFGEEAEHIKDLDGFQGRLETLDRPSQSTDDPFIALYYPDRKLHSNYLSEYLRKFHRMPLPKRRDRV